MYFIYSIIALKCKKLETNKSDDDWLLFTPLAVPIFITFENDDAIDKVHILICDNVFKTE